MKNIDKNSPNRKQQSDNTLIYILLLFLVAIMVGTIVYLAWPGKKEQSYNYEEELGDFQVAPDAGAVSKLIAGNRSRRKTIERVLEDKIKGKKLAESEKEEVRQELESVNKNLDETLQGWVIEDLSPDVLKIIYSQLYDQGKVLTRLKTKTSNSNRTYEELWKQWKVEQQNWQITESEKEEITKKMNDWITGWYKQAMANEVKLTEYIEPLYIRGQEVKKVNGNYSSADIDWFRKKIYIKDEEPIDLRQPLDLKFLGYTGFLGAEDLKKSEEGKETYGLTISTQVSTIGEKDKGDDVVQVNSKNRRWIEIKLKKELFFNRLGYEEWLNKVEKKGKNTSWSYHDICFEEAVDTIAHELAHAVINSVKGRYEGQEGGGHGQLFYQYMQKIGTMMRATPEFSAFEEWWWDLTK